MKNAHAWLDSLSWMLRYGEIKRRRVNDGPGIAALVRATRHRGAWEPDYLARRGDGHAGPGAPLGAAGAGTVDRTPVDSSHSTGSSGGEAVMDISTNKALRDYILRAIYAFDESGRAVG